MNDWQNYVVALLIGLCLLRLVGGLRSFFRKAAGKQNPCGGCSCGCGCSHIQPRAEKEKKKKCCR